MGLWREEKIQAKYNEWLKYSLTWFLLVSYK